MPKQSIADKIFNQIKADATLKDISANTPPSAAKSLAEYLLTSPDTDEFYDMKRERRRKIAGNLIMQKKKRAIKETVINILKNRNYKRPQKLKNPISEICLSIKQEYKNQTGKNFPRADRTLENWIYDYFNSPTN